MKKYVISITELRERTPESRAYDSDEIFSARVEGDETIVAGIQRVVLDYIEIRTMIGGTFYGEPIKRGRAIKVTDDRSPITN